MAVYENTQPFKQSPGDCYQALLAVMPKLGFKITRKRDIGWLILATRPAEGGETGLPLTATITCRPGVTTQVTVACEIRGEDTGGEETAAGEAIFAALKARLAR